VDSSVWDCSRVSPNRVRAASSRSNRTPPGAEYLKENKPELAAPEFKAIVCPRPNNVDARGNLGVILFFQGAYGDAILTPRRAETEAYFMEIQALLGIGEKRAGESTPAATIWSRHFRKVQEEKIRIEAGWSW